MLMFEIKDLSVSVENKRIIQGLSLNINDGETHVIMGPNGAGKSTLAEALLGHPSLHVQGKIILDKKDISKLSTDERAREGLFLAFQNPEEIEGVTVSNFLRKAKFRENKDLDLMITEHEELEKNAMKIGMGKDFVKRELNVGFSGGEKKRMEILQAISLKPKVLVMDEVDSGLDVDGLKLISEALENMKDGKRCFLIITHYPRILKHLKAEYVHILINGKIVKSGTEELAHEIEENGYTPYLKGKHV
ncbi:Fe-S cluster assembly ATPase SufC [Candidatus Micrarchaeota archaeon]|nr:Fe-S cluster assembly ATPase SufC [Candidatus Micrarchaeota archaeon]